MTGCASRASAADAIDGAANPACNPFSSIIYIMQIKHARVARSPTDAACVKRPASIGRSRCDRTSYSALPRSASAHGPANARGGDDGGFDGRADPYPTPYRERLRGRGSRRTPRLRPSRDRREARLPRPLCLRPVRPARQYRELHRRRAGAGRARRPAAHQRRARAGRLLRADGDDRRNAGREL